MNNNFDYKKMYEDTIFEKITLSNEINNLKITYNNEKNILLKEIEELKDKLKKYTAPSRSKRFYENHKEEIIKKSKEYQKNRDPEKIKEYNKKAYEKRKANEIQLEENN